MLDPIKVKVGPQFYNFSKEAFSFVDQILKERQAKKILIVHGTISWEKAKPYLDFLDNKEYEFIYQQYTGECSYYGTDLLKETIEKEEIDFIIGVGGGKLTDLVGYTASVTNTPFGVIPTLASNCAPWTPLAIMYKENGESEGKSEHFLIQASFFLSHPDLVVDAPVDYFIAGIADTLAKWYESESILAQEEMQEEPFLRLAQAAAKLCMEVLEKDGFKAIDDMKNKVASKEFIRCAEIIFGVAGLVGGFGDKYARNAIAHANHDAISKYLPGSHDYLHGEKVAYGILYQLAVEDKWDTIDGLLDYYAKLNLPNSLTFMNLYPLDDKDMDLIVEFMDGKEKVHLVPIDITKELLKQKLIELEQYVSEKSK